MAAELKFEKLEMVPAKVKASGDLVGLDWFEFIATTKSGTKYKMIFPLPTKQAKQYAAAINKRGFLYADAWKEIK